MKKLFRYLACVLWHGEHEWEYLEPSPTDRCDYFVRCKRCGKRAMFWHPMHGVTWGANAILPKEQKGGEV